MKTCQFCAEEIQDAAVVCKHCGRELNAAARSGPTPSATGSSSAPPRGRGRLYVLLAVAAIAGVIGWASADSADTPPVPNYGSAPPAVVRPPSIVKIADSSAVEIEAGHYMAWSWTGGDRAICKVTGRVLGLAGGDKDVDVMLLNADALINMQNHQAYKTYYESGRQTVSSLAV